MISVLAVPVLNRPDLLNRMLASVDIPVGRLIVIDNSRDGITPSRGEVIRAGANLGVAASWNLAIKVAPMAPWWAIVNSDLRFAPGDLARLAEHMTTSNGIGCLAEFAAFGISAQAVERVGWFDENFVPAYCEDTDYRRRCALAGVPIADLPSQVFHDSSSTLRSDPHLGNENARTYPENVAYYRRKWGGWIGEEVHTTPFGRGGSVADWSLDLRRLRELGWR